jgi:hypothetical protein
VLEPNALNVARYMYVISKSSYVINKYAIYALLLHALIEDVLITAETLYTEIISNIINKIQLAYL